MAVSSHIDTAHWTGEQVKLIKEKFQAALGEGGARMVDINTIDGFQVLPLDSLQSLQSSLSSTCA